MEISHALGSMAKLVIWVVLIEHFIWRIDASFRHRLYEVTVIRSRPIELFLVLRIMREAGLVLTSFAGLASKQKSIRFMMAPPLLIINWGSIDAPPLRLGLVTTCPWHIPERLTVAMHWHIDRVAVRLLHMVQLIDRFHRFINEKVVFHAVELKLFKCSLKRQLIV